MDVSDSTLQASPVQNSEAGDYKVEVYLTYNGETQLLASFTVTIVETSDSNSVSLADDSFVFVNYNYQYGEGEDPLQF
jgi:hypothetical protein